MLEFSKDKIFEKNLKSRVRKYLTKSLMFESQNILKNPRVFEAYNIWEKLELLEQKIFDNLVYKYKIVINKKYLAKVEFKKRKKLTKVRAFVEKFDKSSNFQTTKYLQKLEFSMQFF